MKKPKIETDVIIRTFNECGSLEKTADILGYSLRMIQMRVKNECKWKLEPR